MENQKVKIAQRKHEFESATTDTRYDEALSLVVGERGRVHYDGIYSNEHNFTKLDKKMVPHQMYSGL